VGRGAEIVKEDSIMKRLMREVGQDHEIRKPLYENLEKALGGNKRVVSFFTSFRYPVILEDDDADMLEDVLANTSLDEKDLVPIINSPGGDALAAERIVNVCRSFSRKGFSVIVPKMAKSAATMICLGADEILMNKTSELGPIDPQILIRDDKNQPVRYQAAHEVLDSYSELMKEANGTKGRIEPYLQQLSRFDARDMRRIKSMQDLSENIAVNLLKRGMLKALGPAQIKQRIKPLTDPKRTTDHGRPVFHDEASRCGLKIKVYDNKNKVWQIVWELYVRLNFITSTSVTKVIESIEESYVSPTMS
jgi:hypothetical protein